MYTYSSRLHAFFAAMMEKEDTDLAGIHNDFIHIWFIDWQLVSTKVMAVFPGAPRKRIIQRKADDAFGESSNTQKMYSKINLSGVCLVCHPIFASEKIGSSRQGHHR